MVSHGRHVISSLSNALCESSCINILAVSAAFHSNRCYHIHSVIYWPRFQFFELRKCHLKIRNHQRYLKNENS